MEAMPGKVEMKEGDLGKRSAASTVCRPLALMVS